MLGIQRTIICLHLETIVVIDGIIAAQLMQIAKSALHDLFEVGGPPAPDPPKPPCPDMDYQGAFVTLHVQDDLRGCIGYLSKIKPIGAAVYELAQKSATTDRRFSPLASDELDQVSIEITVLGPMERISEPQELEIGKHGVYLELGRRRGILLPQVASEHGWSPERFVEAACEKALLAPGAWRSPRCSINRFTGIILSSDETSTEGR